MSFTVATVCAQSAHNWACNYIDMGNMSALLTNVMYIHTRRKYLSIYECICSYSIFDKWVYLIYLHRSSV